MPPSYVYAIGRVEWRFPQISIEKELAQASGWDQTTGLADPQAAHQILTRPENRYLVRQLCWVMSIEGLETYILMPRDPGDLDLLIHASRPQPRRTDIDVVIGVKGMIASPALCNGLMVPLVFFDQIYSFDIDAMITSIPVPTGSDADQFKETALNIFDRITQIADNAGNSDGHRALNYLAMRSPTIYRLAAERHQAGESTYSSRGKTVPPHWCSQCGGCGLLFYQPSDRGDGQVFHSGRRN